jgi:hypothetical protein
LRLASANPFTIGDFWRGAFVKLSRRIYSKGLALRQAIWLNFSRMEKFVKRAFFLAVGVKFQAQDRKDNPNILGVALIYQNLRKRANSSHRQKGQPIADMYGNPLLHP